eukprot:scaffold223_cov408-Prasinococcus_capsulatus_cf.AAC.1
MHSSNSTCPRPEADPCAVTYGTAGGGTVEPTDPRGGPGSEGHRPSGSGLPQAAPPGGLPRQPIDAADPPAVGSRCARMPTATPRHNKPPGSAGETSLVSLRE